MAEANQPLAIVIDDEEDARRVVRMALRADGWKVETAEDGQAGYAIIRDLQPDLIVADLMMPGLSGTEMCRKMVMEMGERETPVLMISAVNPKARVLDDFWSLPLRRRGFLRKPFDSTQLIQAVHEVVAHERARREAVPAAAATALPSRPSAASDSPPPPPIMLAEPAPPPRPAAPAAAPAESPPLSGYRILLIDDDPDILTVLRFHLERLHTVEVAGNGMQGLRKLDSFRPDFVIADINMPVLNGLETAEAIRRNPVYCDVPIFFVTGETEADLPRRAYEVGGNLYLRKPLDPPRLIKCIDYFLRETNLAPGHYLNAEPPSAAESPEAPPPASPVAAVPRVLVVDFNIENHRLLRRFLGEEGQSVEFGGGPLELFWAEDPRLALGNLARWEPDVILYNPRNPNLDAVGFGQTLKLSHELDKTRVWLIGTRFYDADVKYSRETFGHEVIALDSDEAALGRQLDQAVRAARAGVRPKQHAWARLQAEETERLRQIQHGDARKARERDSLRKRYRSVQEFIDQTLF